MASVDPLRNPYLDPTYDARPVATLETPAVIVDLPTMHANADKVRAARSACRLGGPRRELENERNNCLEYD